MSRRTITPHQMMITAPVLRQPPPNRHHSRSLIYVGRGLLPCWSAFGRELVVLRDQPKRRLLKITPQIPTMTMIYRRNRKSVISSFISYLIDVYRVFNHLSVFGQLIIGYKLLGWSLDMIFCLAAGCRREPWFPSMYDGNDCNWVE